MFGRIYLWSHLLLVFSLWGNFWSQLRFGTSNWIVLSFYFFLVLLWKIELLKEFVHFFHVIHFIAIELFIIVSYQFSSVLSLSRIRLFATPWIAARQASLSIINSRSSLKLMSIESVMPSSHLILGRPLLLLPPIPPSIRIFSSESSLHMRWPKYWSFSFSISPPSEHPGPISFIFIFF